MHSFAEQTSLARAVAAVRDAASAADVVIVALHKGLVHEPARIADYEREVSHAMVDAGAQAVVSHHAHIGKGIEIYRGRPILHGLGNFATVTRALALDGDDPGRAAWARNVGVCSDSSPTRRCRPTRSIPRAATP